RRQLMRDAADELAKKTTPLDKSEHEGHAGLLRTRSLRPLVDTVAQAGLPAIKADGINALPWSVVTQTTLDRQYRPTFPRYLRDLEGKQATLQGFMQPLGEDSDQTSFLLIEYPVGCWYCEMPEVTAIIFVELPPRKTRPYTRDLL